MIPLEIAISFLVILLCALIILAWPDDVPKRPERKPPVGGNGTAKPESIVTTDERIEKLEREVAELRGIVLAGGTETMRPFVGPDPIWESDQEFKRPTPPMCDEGGWNNIPGTCGPIVPIHYPEEPPSWDITTMIEEGRKQMLTSEGERLVREAKQQDLPQCHL